MEAMAKGLPVMASAVSGVPEELGETGKLLPDPKLNPTGTIRELVKTIITWSESPQLRQLAGLGCKRRAEALFREERMLREYSETIERMLLPGNRTPDRASQASTLPPARILEPERYFHYSSLVWQGWYAYYRGDCEEMVRCLHESLKYTPFLKMSTIANWLKNAVSFFDEKGQRLNVYRLSELPEWKKLIEYTIGDRSVR